MKITIETLDFPCEIKTKLLKMISKKNKILFTIANEYFEVVIYENDYYFYQPELANPISLI